MQMRLAFAVAAHLDPDILLLDEVLAVGDLSFQQKCLERVEGLVNEGRTLVFVSHSLDAITRFCDRCLWIDGGRIRQDGPAERVVEAYLEELAGVRASPTLVPAVSNGFKTADWHSPIRQLTRRGRAVGRASGRSEPLGSVQRHSLQASAIPGDDDTRLVSVRLLGADGRERSSVAVDEPFAIEITFDVLREGKNIQPAIYFKTPTDQYMFVVAYTDPEWLERRRPSGGTRRRPGWNRTCERRHHLHLSRPQHARSVRDALHRGPGRLAQRLRAVRGRRHGARTVRTRVPWRGPPSPPLGDATLR